MSAATDRYLTLARSELPLDTVLLARCLIGKLLVRETPEGALSGRIVETEAYPIGDAAGHAYIGMTSRNRALFLCRGHAYVYLAYGVSFLLNVSSETVGVGAGVLIRALEPLDGIPLMQRNRRLQNLRDLARGPDVSLLHSMSIVVWTAPTSAGSVPCGSRVTTMSPRKSASAHASAFRARPTSSCASTSEAIPS